MVIKRVGFLFGAVVAGIGVMLFNMWRHVSDEDRLRAVLLDHCIPYVQTGAAPFGDIGRTLGVYDGIDVRSDLANGSNRLVYDGRFVAQWGEIDDEDSAVRACIVNDIYARADSKGFELPPTSLADWVDTEIAPDTGLIAEQTDLAPPPRQLS